MFVNRKVALTQVTTDFHPGGERRFRIHEDIGHNPVVLIASVLPDPASLFELLAIIRLLRSNRVRDLALMIPYLGYARWDAGERGEEADTGLLVAQILRNANIDKIYIIDPHSDAIADVLGPTVRKIDVTAQLAKPFQKQWKAEVVLAMDEHARDRAQSVAGALGYEVEVGAIKKIRNQKGVRCEFADVDLSGRQVLLVDDMVDTGATLLEAVRFTSDKGASSIAAVSTHGLFQGTLLDRLSSTPLTTLVVSNTIAQTRHEILHTVDITKTVTARLHEDALGQQ